MAVPLARAGFSLVSAVHALKGHELSSRGLPLAGLARASFSRPCAGNAPGDHGNHLNPPNPERVCVTTKEIGDLTDV
jgi:hypothetical protein